MSTVKNVLVPTSTRHRSYFASVKTDGHFVGHFWLRGSGRLCYGAAQMESWRGGEQGEGSGALQTSLIITGDSTAQVEPVNTDKSKMFQTPVHKR